MGDGMVTAYAPPGDLGEFDDTLLQQWSTMVSEYTDYLIRGTPRCQYFNLLNRDRIKGPLLRQDIMWNAFPGNQFRRWGRDYALILADQLMSLDQYWAGPSPLWQGDLGSALYYRPQDEYCEWRVARNADGQITRVDFTSEPPEYFQALGGGELAWDHGDDPGKVTFTGDHDTLLGLYKTHVSSAVGIDDLLWPMDVWEGSGSTPPADDEDAPPTYAARTYNPYNRWNTTHGLMHLTHPSNTLLAEIGLGAQATQLRSHPERASTPVADPDALICRAGYGGFNRCSDPTIGGSVNQLTARGYGVTLADPVGLYMDHLDVSGFTIGSPHGSPLNPDDWFTVTRGEAGMISRAVFAPPDGSPHTVSDVYIAGEPIRFGGQLAERMTVKLVGLADMGADHANSPIPFGALPGDKSAYVFPANPAMVYSTATDADLPAGAIVVYDYPDSVSGARGAVNTVDVSGPELRCRRA